MKFWTVDSLWCGWNLLSVALTSSANIGSVLRFSVATDFRLLIGSEFALLDVVLSVGALWQGLSSSLPAWS